MAQLRARIFCCGTLVVLLLSAAPGGADSPPEPASPQASVDTDSGQPRGGGSGRNLLMGTGEPREPEPFTLEQRFLHGVRNGDHATVERALELGVSVDAKDDLGRSALLLAARDAGSLELVRFLRERGAAVDEPDLGGRTALSFAAGKGRLDLVRYLAAQGAAVDGADRQGRTPLFHAVFGNHLEVVSFLIEQGAEANPRDHFRDTPLMSACAKGLGEMAEILLASGADPALRDQEGRTARDRAAPGTAPCLRLKPASTTAPGP